MIDAHVHFWNYDPIKYDWITDDMKAIRKDFMPKNLSPIYDELNIKSCVAVQVNQSEEENNFLLNLASQTDIVGGIVGWIDLKNPNLQEHLTYWKSFDLIKGWRHILQAENSDFRLHPDFISGLKQLKDFGYTYDLLCYHDQLGDILKMVNQLPDQPLVLDHCGKPNVKTQNLKTWTENIVALSQNPNLYCKLSGLLTEADWKLWKEDEIFSCFDVVFDNFGYDRVMYASDWPVQLISKPYQDWYYLVKNYTKDFKEEHKQSLFVNNAKRFYKL